jgi:hypothetical protein
MYFVMGTANLKLTNVFKIHFLAIHTNKMYEKAIFQCLNYKILNLNQLAFYL